MQVQVAYKLQKQKYLYELMYGIFKAHLYSVDKASNQIN